MFSLPSWRMCCRPFSAHQSMASTQHACNSQGQRQTATTATLIDKASSLCALLGFQALCPAIVATFAPRCNCSSRLVLPGHVKWSTQCANAQTLSQKRRTKQT